MFAISLAVLPEKPAAKITKGFAAPQQPADYIRPIRTNWFTRLFAIRHEHCGGKLIPYQRRGSFIDKRCTDCGAVMSDVD